MSDSLQRRVEVVSVGTKHLDEMSSFHDYQLAKQERQKEHRANVLARVSVQAWASAGKAHKGTRGACGRLESLTFDEWATLNTRGGFTVLPFARCGGPFCRSLIFVWLMLVFCRPWGRSSRTR